MVIPIMELNINYYFLYIMDTTISLEDSIVVVQYRVLSN